MTNYTLTLWQLFIAVIPITIALFTYFVHLEVTLAKIKRDLCWIKKILEDHQT